MFDVRGLGELDVGSWPLLASCLPSAVCLVKSTYDLIKRDGCGLPGEETLFIPRAHCPSQLGSSRLLSEHQLNTRPGLSFPSASEQGVGNCHAPLSRQEKTESQSGPGTGLKPLGRKLSVVVPGVDRPGLGEKPTGKPALLRGRGR